MSCNLGCTYLDYEPKPKSYSASGCKWCNLTSPFLVNTNIKIECPASTTTVSKYKCKEAVNSLRPAGWSSGGYRE